MVLLMIVEITMDRACEKGRIFKENISYKETVANNQNKADKISRK